MKANFVKGTIFLCSLFSFNCALDEGKSLYHILDSVSAASCTSSLCGDGSQADPYRIYNYEQLKMASADLSSYYLLEANIDASASWTEGTSGCVGYDGSNGAAATCEGFEPIGSDGNEFTGNLNGMGYTIDNLYINRPGTDDLGLFGQTSGASLEDIGITNAYINGNNRVGVLAGQIEGGTEVQSSYAEGSVNGGDAAGGLVGQQVDGRIGSSYARANVNIVRSGAQHDAGGLVGQQDMGTIENSYAAGDITGGSDSDNIGGLVGRNQAGVIQNSYAAGSLSGGNGPDDMGGLVGVIFADFTFPVSTNGRVINSYAMGDLSGGTDNDRIGGLVGIISGGELTNSYAVGSVDGDGGTNTTGGFIGDLLTSLPIVMGNNYFVDDDNTTGVGSLSSPATTITQVTGTNSADRLLWMQNTLDETSDTGLDWDSALDANSNPIWNNLNGAGFPCIASINFGRGGCPL